MTTQFICAWTVRATRPVLTDETCDLLCNAAQEKSRETGLDISFAVADADGLLRRFRHFGDVLVLSATLVPAKAYTSAITQTPIGELVQYVAEGGNLMGMNTCVQLQRKRGCAGLIAALGLRGGGNRFGGTNADGH